MNEETILEIHFFFSILSVCSIVFMWPVILWRVSNGWFYKLIELLIVTIIPTFYVVWLARENNKPHSLEEKQT